MAWTDTATAITALRTLLGDGTTDKYCYQKPVFGSLNGTNLAFKTFEFRRITNFTTAATPLGVYKNGVRVAAAGVTSDDVASGEFILVAAPIDGDKLAASYYYQWFTDAELGSFLANASSWLSLGTTYINVPDGLNAAALRFAAQEAYEKLSVKYSVRASETYRLEDSPTEDILKSVEAFKSMADSYMDRATTLRDDYYKRSGQSLQPLFNLSAGGVKDPTPRR